MYEKTPVFTARVNEHENRLPRDITEHSLLDISKHQMDKVLRDLLLVPQFWAGVLPRDLQRSLTTSSFCDSVTNVFKSWSECTNSLDVLLLYWQQVLKHQTLRCSSYSNVTEGITGKFKHEWIFWKCVSGHSLISMLLQYQLCAVCSFP